MNEKRLACEVAIQQLCDAWVEGEDTSTLLQRGLTVYRNLADLRIEEMEKELSECDTLTP